MESKQNKIRNVFNSKIVLNIFLLVVVLFLIAGIWYMWQSVNHKLVQDEIVPQSPEANDTTSPVPRELTDEERTVSVKKLEERQIYTKAIQEEQSEKVVILEERQTQQMPSEEERAAKLKALEERQF